MSETYGPHPAGEMPPETPDEFLRVLAGEAFAAGRDSEAREVRGSIGQGFDAEQRASVADWLASFWSDVAAALKEQDRRYKAHKNAS